MKTAGELLFDLKSSDASIRDRAALQVIDHKIEAAVPVLLESILNPRNKGFIGPLVYALGHFDCTSCFPKLVEISISHGYEAAWGAMSIIDNQKLKPSQKHLEEALGIMKVSSSKGLTDNQSEAMRLIRERYYEE